MPHFVETAVETALCHFLQQGKFCHIAQPANPIVSSEQLSLCKQTSAEMENRGYRSIVIQARSLIPNHPKDRHAWDQEFIKAIWHSLHSADFSQLSPWLEATIHLSRRDRLIAFASDLLLNEICAMPFVIFIENIEALRALPYAPSDVFAWIEHCYELRDTYLTYHHLSFAVFSAEIIDQIVLAASDFPSSFKGIIKTCQHLDDCSGQYSGQCNGQYSGQCLNHRADAYAENRSSTFSERHSPNIIKAPVAGGLTGSLNGEHSVSGQSQYAKGTAKMQTSVHRYRYDSSDCSYLAC